MGRLFVLPRFKEIPAMYTDADVGFESMRVEAAIQTAKEQLGSLRDKACREAGEKAAAIFDIHVMMLEDDEFTGSIHGVIENGNLSAEYAVHAACEWYADALDASGNPYMQERGADVRDLTRRVAQILAGGGQDEFAGIKSPVVLAAREILPSQTILAGSEKALAFLSKKGSVNCHSSVLARMLGIPAVISLGNDFGKLKNDELCIVDAQSGLVIISPDKDTIAQYEEKIANQKKTFAAK